MQANLTHYEDLSQLEDDIVSFLPTVSDIEVFGCEVDLFAPDTQLPLSEDFHTTLLQQNRLQIVVRPCTEEGHSIWQFQESDRERYPKAVRVPTNPRKEIADRAFYAAPMCSCGERDQARWVRRSARLPTTANCQTPTFRRQP